MRKKPNLFYRTGCTYVMGHMGNMDKVTVMLYALPLLKMQGYKIYKDTG